MKTLSARGDGTPAGGRVQVTRLTTGEIHADGGIAENTPDLISGGVLVIYGVFVERVENIGTATTYGANDMVLDNWGNVREWVARAPVVSRGTSGIGFVQFGDIGSLRVEAPIKTFGKGAPSFNLYAGSLREASFHSITTHADGGALRTEGQEVATLQVQGKIDRLDVREGIHALGQHSDAVVMEGGDVPLEELEITARDGERIRIHQPKDA